MSILFVGGVDMSRRDKKGGKKKDFRVGFFCGLVLSGIIAAVCFAVLHF